MSRRNNRSLLANLSVGLCIWMGVALGHTSRACAQTDEQRTVEARGLYDAGAVAFDDGRFEDALDRWRVAYEISELPALLYNIGTAHDRLGQPSEALEKYRAYLDAVPDAQNTNYVTRRISVLEAQVEAANQVAEPAPVQETRVEVDPVNALENPDQATDGPVANGQSESSGGANVPAIIVTAAGGALLVAGLATGLSANSRYSSLEDECVDGRCTSAQQGSIDSLSTLALTTDILLAVGGVATVAGVIWLIVGGGDEDETAAVDVHIGPRGVALSGRF